MADYSSWKVADLKAELKNRGIPQTGLRLKQHFIDKLAEDTKASSDTTAAAEPEPIEAEGAQPEAIEEKTPAVETSDQQQVEAQPTQSLDQQPTQEEQQAAAKEQSPSSAPQAEGEPQQKDEEQKPEEPEGQVEGEKQETDDGRSNEKIEETDVAPQAAAPSDDLNKSQIVERPSEDIEKQQQEESVQPVDKTVLSAAQTSEANTELSTPLPVEEALEDKRKRKRRSQSPVPTPEAIAAKKTKAEEEGPQLLSKDTESNTLKQREEQKTSDESSPHVVTAKPPTPVKQDARFRGLFAPTEAVSVRRPSPSRDIVMEDAEVEPARHAATASLYIDGLMRPLQPIALRNHLVQLATAVDEPTNTETIDEFFLDPIKTHCFVRFRDTQAASRVRSSIHGKVWPNERNRKNLWADFIPDEKIQEWIQTEEASRNRAGPPVRWEVHYETTDEGTTATLSEAGPHSRSAPSKAREAVIDGPLGPHGSSSSQADRQQPSAPPSAPSRPGQGFKPLDELFKSTTAKPKLYYLPVARDIADKRLDQFDELLRKGSFPRRGGDEMRRITFENDDEFVDIGPEYGRAAAQRRQERGGRGGGRGRNWRGRGG